MTRSSPPVAARKPHAATFHTVQRDDPSTPATCRLLAQSTDFQPVAESPVPIPASTAEVVDLKVTLTTLRRATSATVRSCTSD